jgi:hypothetical protein
MVGDALQDALALFFFFFFFESEFLFRGAYNEVQRRSRVARSVLRSVQVQKKSSLAAEYSKRVMAF